MSATPIRIQRKRTAPPTPWVSNGWGGGRTISYVLLLPGVKSASVEYLDDTPGLTKGWYYKVNDSSHRFVPKTGCYVREEQGPFTNANAAAEECEAVVAQQIKVAARIVAKIRRAA